VLRLEENAHGVERPELPPRKARGRQREPIGT
jgi:hypothetical protein